MVSPTEQEGTIIVPDVPSGSYRVVWWDTWAGMPVLTRTVDGSFTGLSLSLPHPITDDIAVQWEWLGSASWKVLPPYLPVILRDYDS